MLLQRSSRLSRRVFNTPMVLTKYMEVGAALRGGKRVRRGHGPEGADIQCVFFLRKGLLAMRIEDDGMCTVDLLKGAFLPSGEFVFVLRRVALLMSSSRRGA